MAQIPSESLTSAASLSLHAATSLDSSEREAEARLGGPIQVVEAAEMGTVLGETFCGGSEVVIPFTLDLQMIFAKL